MGLKWPSQWLKRAFKQGPKEALNKAFQGLQSLAYGPRESAPAGSDRTGRPEEDGQRAACRGGRSPVGGCWPVGRTEKVYRRARRRTEQGRPFGRRPEGQRPEAGGCAHTGGRPAGRSVCRTREFQSNRAERPCWGPDGAQAQKRVYFSVSTPFCGASFMCKRAHKRKNPRGSQKASLSIKCLDRELKLHTPAANQSRKLTAKGPNDAPISKATQWPNDMRFEPRRVRREALGEAFSHTQAAKVNYSQWKSNFRPKTSGQTLKLIQFCEIGCKWKRVCVYV